MPSPRIPRLLHDLPPLAGCLYAAVCNRLAELLLLDLAGVPAGFNAAKQRLRVALSRESVLELDLMEWLARSLTDAEKVAAHRALAALERAGLISRLRFGPCGRRTTHVRVEDLNSAAA